MLGQHQQTCNHHDHHGEDHDVALHAKNSSRYVSDALQREAIQEAEIAGEQGEASQRNQQSEDDEQHAAENLDRVQVAAEAGIEAEKAIDAERGEKKRNRQPRRVNGQQQNSLEYRILRAGQQQDSGEDGADARGPAEGKGKANEERAERTGASLDAVQALVRIERVDLEDVR